MAHEKKIIIQNATNAIHQKQIINRQVFTDRETPRNIFWDRYKNFITQKNSGAVSVLEYYGVGGIGKTTLLKQIEIELSHESPETKTLYWNFEEETAPIEVVNRFKNILVAKYNFSFPLFELGYYHYKQNSGINLPESQKKKLVDENSTLGLVLDVAETIPVTETAVKLFKLCGNIVGKIRDVIEANPTIPEEIDAQKTPENLVKYLLNLFAEEMCKNLAKEKAPFVILLDTYEILVNENANGIIARKEDLWLRENSDFSQGIIWKIPNVMWVIAGRESLKWKEDDDAWDESELFMYSLGDFSECDSISYLQNSVGMTDEDLCKALHKLTKGTPIYLSACADLFVQLKNSKKEKISIEDFGKSPEDLVLRFLRNLPANKIRIVQMLSCLKIFNDEIIKDVGPKVISQFDWDAFEDIKKLSFIVKISNDYMMHSTFSDALLADKSCIEMCRKIYEPATKAIGTKGSYEALCAFQIRILPIIIKQIDQSTREIIPWRMKYASALEDARRYWDSIDYYKETLQLIDGIYADIDWMLHQKIEIILRIELIYGVRLNLGYEAHIQNIERIKYMLQLFKEKKKSSFFDAKQEIEFLREIWSDSPSPYDNEVKEIRDDANNRYWQQLVNQGIYKETIDSMENFPDIAFRDFKNNDIIDYQKQLIEKYQKVLGKNSEQELALLKQLAHKIYRTRNENDYDDSANNKIYEESLTYYNLLQEKYREKCGINSEQELELVPIIAEILNHLSRYDEGFKLYENTYEIYKIKYGFYDPKTYDILGNFINYTPEHTPFSAEENYSDNFKIENDFDPFGDSSDDGNKGTEIPPKFNKEKYVMEFFEISKRKWIENNEDIAQKVKYFTLEFASEYGSKISSKTKEYLLNLLLENYKAKYELEQTYSKDAELLKIKLEILECYKQLKNSSQEIATKRDVVHFCLNSQSDLFNIEIKEEPNFSFNTAHIELYSDVLDNYKADGDQKNIQMILDKLSNIPCIAEYNKLFGNIAIWSVKNDNEKAHLFQTKYLDSYDYSFTGNYDIFDRIEESLAEDESFKKEFEARIDKAVANHAKDNNAENEIKFYDNIKSIYSAIGCESKAKQVVYKKIELRQEMYGDDSSLVIDSLLDYANELETDNREDIKYKLPLYEKILKFYKEHDYEFNYNVVHIKKEAAYMNLATGHIDRGIELLVDCAQFFTTDLKEKSVHGYFEDDLDYREWFPLIPTVSAHLMHHNQCEKALDLIMAVIEPIMLNGEFNFARSNNYYSDGLDSNKPALQLLKILDELSIRLAKTEIMEKLVREIMEWKENQNLEHLSISNFIDAIHCLYLEYAINDSDELPVFGTDYKPDAVPFEEYFLRSCNNDAVGSWLVGDTEKAISSAERLKTELAQNEKTPDKEFFQKTITMILGT